MARMRTIQQAYQHIKRIDPETIIRMPNFRRFCKTACNRCGKSRSRKSQHDK